MQTILFVVLLQHLPRTKAFSKHLETCMAYAATCSLVGGEIKLTLAHVLKLRLMPGFSENS